MNKEGIISELKRISKNLGYSVKKRDIPYNFYNYCIKKFGSFNKAKKKAGLETRNERIVNFPINAFKSDEDLAKIISYLTFDGHLYNDLSAFYLSSCKISILKDFERLVKNKFGMAGKYYFYNGGIKNNTHKFIVFNKRICKKLLSLGVPKGDKSIQKFNIPKWVFSSKPLAREYLKTAFLCKGSFKEESKRTPRIQINISKSESTLSSGLEFMNSLKEMLGMFGISTTKIYISGKRIRKRDSKISRDIKFRIEIKDNNKFINEIFSFT
jgi:hypothetical protein